MNLCGARSLLLPAISKLILAENTLLANVVGHKHLEEVVCDLVMVCDRSHLISYDGRLLLENSYSAHHFDPFIHLNVDVLEGLGCLVLTLLVENNLERFSVVTQFVHYSHSLLFFGNQSSNNDDLQ